MKIDNSPPVVSVIIPAFNRNHTLPRAVGGAVGQTFRDLEIIVVDDASREPVAEALAACTDPRVRLIVHEKNRGANAARNSGIVSAKGQYVAFLDSDDEWHPDKIRIQVEAMEAAAASVAGHCTGLTAFSEAGRKLFEKSPQLSGNIYPQLLRRNEIGPLSSVLVRRAVLNEVGLFDESLPSSQDWDLYLRIAERYEFASVGEALVRYNLGQDSISRNLKAKALGRRMILEKYESQMTRFPEAFASQLVKTGHYHCRAGAIRDGRQSFRRAMRINPVAANAYLFFALSFLGGGGYERLVKVRKWIGQFR